MNHLLRHTTIFLALLTIISLPLCRRFNIKHPFRKIGHDTVDSSSDVRSEEGVLFKLMMYSSLSDSYV